MSANPRKTPQDRTLQTVRALASAYQAKRSHTGNATEKLVEMQHKLLASLGVAFVYKVSTPMRVIRNTRDTKEIAFTAKSCADYLGHAGPAYPGGTAKAIAVECKHIAPRQLVSGENAAPSMGLERVEKHQALCLDRVHDAGGVAVVLIVYNHGERMFAVPWQEMRKAQGALRGEALERWAVPRGKLYLPLRTGERVP